MIVQEKRRLILHERKKMNTEHPIFLVLFFLLLHGCASTYTVPSSNYPQHEGEINQHIRLIQAEKERIFKILTDEILFHG